MTGCEIPTGKKTSSAETHLFGVTAIPTWNYNFTHSFAQQAEKIKDSGKTRFTRPHINNRCKKLENYGLLVNIENGVYSVTEEGREYLDGDLDAQDLTQNH